MGKFEKGNKGGGRPKGKLSVKTETWQTFADYCLEGGLAKFKTELNNLKGKEYVNAFLTLLEFHKPKLARAVDKDGEDAITPSKITIEVIHSGPDVLNNEKEIDV